jgi:FKBP-type peptidyl-prolyl cis-trans isomerase FklB
MKNTRRSFAAILSGLALAGPLLCADEKATTLAGIHVSFKLDPRLTTGVYGGERWISGPTYTGATAQDTVEAKAQGADAKGRLIPITPEWIPADPEMATVSPSRGEAVKIIVKRPGESRLKVTAQGISTELSIKAEQVNDFLQLEISQSAVKAPAPESPRFKDDDEKLSYALGLDVGARLRQQWLEVAPDLYMQGLKDGLAGREPLLTEAEARLTVRELVIKRQTARQAQLAEANTKEGEAFLRANQAKDGVITLKSGLQYKVLKAGHGKRPTPDDTVLCRYRGTLIDGTEVETSYKRNTPVAVALKSVMKGWSEALQLMPVGSKWQLFIPAALAYGEQGAPRVHVGPNAALILEIELVSIQDASVEKSQATHKVSAARKR